MVTHAGFQYVAYYDADRWVCVARRALPGGAWDIARLTDYKFGSNDAHNTISMGLCAKDGTIHLAFDHHGHPLHYRVSKKGAASQPGKTSWTADVFGPVLGELEKDKPIRITYPRFIPTPDGGLQFCYRRGGSGNGDRMLVDYDSGSNTWKDTRQIDSGKGPWRDGAIESASRCSYPNGYEYGPLGNLHATWVWREGAQTANHDLVHVYSEDRGMTWKNTAGKAIKGFPAIDTPDIAAVKISHTLGLMNTHGQAVDSKGRIHAVVWHCTEESLKAAGSAPGATRWGPPGTQRYHHYWRDKAGVWQHRELPGAAGSRPKILMDSADNAFLIFRGNGQFSHTGSLVIAAASAASKWMDWRVVHVEEGPFGNEMLADSARWKAEGVLSIMAQEAPEQPHQPTALHILDFTIDSPSP
jgi:BNR repeat-containing family member